MLSGISDSKLYFRVDNWLGRVSEGLWNGGDKVERTAPLPLVFAPWI
jgi:hypothetical protein